jgi:hypothetical protein
MAKSLGEMEVFRKAFAENRWGSRESISGPGSTLKATELIRSEMPRILDLFYIKSLVDAPCGDYNWIQRLDYSFEKYIGIDVVPELIDSLRQHQSNGRRFQYGNIITDILPVADAVLCRDCLVHFSFNDAMSALANFRLAGFRYALLTTFPGRENADIKTGNWRPIDMSGAPFLLGEPLTLMRERPHNPEDKYNDKHLGLWRLS